MDDVDFKNNGIKIHRKGGAEVVVYFGEEVRSALMEYMVERQKITAADGSVNALFLSLQNKRISVIVFSWIFGMSTFTAGSCPIISFLYKYR